LQGHLLDENVLLAQRGPLFDCIVSASASDGVHCKHCLLTPVLVSFDGVNVADKSLDGLSLQMMNGHMSLKCLAASWLLPPWSQLGTVAGLLVFIAWSWHVVLNKPQACLLVIRMPQLLQMGLHHCSAEC